jgi:hypothetical protein
MSGCEEGESMSETAFVAPRQAHPVPQKPTSQRAVFFLPETYLANVDAFAGVGGISKSEVVRLALASFFATQGMNPEKNPRVVAQFEYD